jgi:Zn finger protein HypA/HybF involved in hydrogenase expression
MSSEKCTCTKCKKEIDLLDRFPRGLCLDCHAAKFDIEARLTKSLPVPNFSQFSSF